MAPIAPWQHPNGSLVERLTDLQERVAAMSPEERVSVRLQLDAALQRIELATGKRFWPPRR